jgi:hypothetical protein
MMIFPICATVCTNLLVASQTQGFGEWNLNLRGTTQIANANCWSGSFVLASRSTATLAEPGVR